MARSSALVLAAYVAITLGLFLLLSLPPQRHHLPHRRLKLRPSGTVRNDHRPVPFDPLISDIELRIGDRQWERLHVSSTGQHTEPQPDWQDLVDAEDYINDEDKFNVTLRISLLFPKIDISPADGFITHQELVEWNFNQAEREVMHRTRRDMELHDKNNDGFIAFEEYEPPGWARRFNDNSSNDDEIGWWKEGHFNASDVDDNGLLNLTEFKDFLHPADSMNPNLIEWLCQDEIRQRDEDGDGKLNFQEYLAGLFRLIRNYDEFSLTTPQRGSSSEIPAKKLFAQLDLNNDGFLSAHELRPVINDLHPSERFFAKQQADYVLSQADTDKDGRLSLKEMIDNPYVFYSAIFSEENDYMYHDEFR